MTTPRLILLLSVCFLPFLGVVGCADPDSSVAENTADTCQDDKDNDGNGLTDCDDKGCFDFVFCQPALNSVEDAGTNDTGTGEDVADDPGSPGDTNVARDSGSDTSVRDTAARDTGRDTNPPDSGRPDTGQPDTGAVDAGPCPECNGDPYCDVVGLRCECVPDCGGERMCVQNTHNNNWYCAAMCDPCDPVPCENTQAACQVLGPVGICWPGTATPCGE